ncbi:hypothetical protein [Acidimangrovimonas pyrenivorans]|uniref:Uncharacterized protein n=1 Tax=Acidimangrovimonas pyrenivorans TaxID=2030798 RepID=A0ABV7AEV8_9RHOB
MQPELATRRRLLRLTFQRYIEADREWREALLEMKSWFPKFAAPHGGAIGNPGSRVRRVYDARARALLQFEAAQAKFETAKRRLAERERHNATCVLAIARLEAP